MHPKMSIESPSPSSEELQRMCPNLDESEAGLSGAEILAMFDDNGDGGVDEAEFEADDKEFAAGLLSCWQLLDIPHEGSMRAVGRGPAGGSGSCSQKQTVP